MDSLLPSVHGGTSLRNLKSGSTLESRIQLCLQALGNFHQVSDACSDSLPGPDTPERACLGHLEGEPSCLLLQISLSQGPFFPSLGDLGALGPRAKGPPSQECLSVCPPRPGGGALASEGVAVLLAGVCGGQGQEDV